MRNSHFSRRIYFLAYFFILAIPSHALATSEPLTYKTDYRASLRALLLDYFEQDEGSYKYSDFSIAHIDLNNDGIDEHILKEKGCTEKKYDCLHLIMAEKTDNLILLGHINSRDLMIGQTYSHGIKDLLSFENPINEYKFNIYMWSPLQKKYIMSDE